MSCAEATSAAPANAAAHRAAHSVAAMHDAMVPPSSPCGDATRAARVFQAMLRSRAYRMGGTGRVKVGRPVPNQGQRIVGGCAEVELAPLQLEAPGLHLGGVQDVVNEREQVP